MNAATTAMAYIFPLITFPYVARVLTADGYGIAELALATAQFFSLFALLGINLYGTRECARVRDDAQTLSKVSQELFFIVLCSTIVACAAYLFAICTIPSFNSHFYIFLMAGAMIPLSTIGVQWFMNANEQYAFIAVRNLVTKSAIIVLMFLFVQSESDVLPWVAISVLANGGANIMNFVHMRRNTHFTPFRELSLRPHLKPMLLFFLATASISIYTCMDSIMLGLMAGEDAVAYYRVSIKIKNLLTAAMLALTSVLVPRVSYLTARGDTERFERITSKSVQAALLFGIYVPALVAVLAEPIILILGGAEYLESVGVLRVVMPAVLFVSLTQITANQILTPLGKEKYMTVSYCTAGALDLLLNLFLIPLWGAFGAAISTSIAEFIVLAIQVVFIARIMPIRPLLKGSMLVVIPACIAALFSALLTWLIADGFVEALIVTVSSFVVLVLSLLAFNRKNLFSAIRESRDTSRHD